MKEGMWLRLAWCCWDEGQGGGVDSGPEPPCSASMVVPSRSQPQFLQGKPKGIIHLKHTWWDSRNYWPSKKKENSACNGKKSLPVPFPLLYPCSPNTFLFPLPLLIHPSPWFWKVYFFFFFLSGIYLPGTHCSVSQNLPPEFLSGFHWRKRGVGGVRVSEPQPFLPCSALKLHEASPGLSFLLCELGIILPALLTLPHPIPTPSSAQRRPKHFLESHTTHAVCECTCNLGEHFQSLGSGLQPKSCRLEEGMTHRWEPLGS